MSYPPYCMLCKSNHKNKDKTSLYWNSDFSTEDYGYDNYDGIIGVYSCPNEECETTYEIIDFFIEDNKDVRAIKYVKYNEDEDMYYGASKEEMICSCMYCSSELYNIDTIPFNDINIPEFSYNENITSLKCFKCSTIYDVVDSMDKDKEEIENRIIIIRNKI